MGMTKDALDAISQNSLQGILQDLTLQVVAVIGPTSKGAVF